MRLGEVKQKIDRVITENKIIGIKSEAIYGGAQKIENYSEIIEVLEYFSILEWSGIKKDEIDGELLSKYPSDSTIKILPQEDFNKLNSFVGRVNEKLPLYYSILETITQKQNEQIINIKLPESIKSLSDLAKTNKDLEDLFKTFNFGGTFEFKGFDRGTSWYEILITAPLVFRYFIACLGVALLVVQLKKTYYESETAKLSYKVSLKKDEELTEKGLNDYCSRYIDAYLEERVRMVVKDINNTNGKTPEEATSGLVIATKKLIDRLGDGVEFHLSLNPPPYAVEQAGQLNIDYAKMPKIDSDESKKPKQVKSPQLDKINKIDSE